MDIKGVTKKDNSRVELCLEIDRDSFQKALDKAYNQNKSSIYVPGFRKGKAPRKIVEGMYGKNIFYEDAINILYPEVFSQACEKAEINAVGTPAVDDLNVSEDGVLSLTMSVDVYPEVEIADYKGVEAYRPSAEVTEEDVQAEIEKLLERNSRIVTVERPIAEGDTAVIDFEGFIDGVPFEGGKGENHNLKIGSGSFIPGFEDALIGLSAGDSKDVEVTFPEEYHEELAGKPAVFKCVVHEVKENQKPSLDDEFAVDLGHDNLDQLKADTEKKLKDSKEESAKSTFENNVIEAVAGKLKADIPQSMIESRLDKVIDNFSYQVQMAGMRMEDYMNMIGADMQSLRASYIPLAISQVKSELALEKIAGLEGVEVSDEEIEAEYNRLAETYNMEVEKVKEYMPAEDIAHSLKLDKASKLIVEAAVATDKLPEPSEEDKEQIKQVVDEAVKAAAEPTEE